MKTKICSECKREKIFKEFHKQKTAKDGYSPWCKVCRKKYFQNNKEKIVEQRKIYYQENKEKLLVFAKKYREDNKKKRKEINKKYKNNKYHTDIQYKILDNLRSRVYKALKGKSKSKTTLKLLGCSVEFLREHLESQFTEGMTWDNHSFRGWHIDHIKPCAKFDLSKESEQRKCFHYTNLQPLWAEENRKKSDKYGNQSL